MHKDFNNFLETLNEETYLQWPKTGERMNLKFNIPTNNEEMTLLISNIASLNSQLTLAIIKEYHDWLSKD